MNHQIYCAKQNLFTMESLKDYNLNNLKDHEILHETKWTPALVQDVL